MYVWMYKPSSVDALVILLSARWPFGQLVDWSARQSIDRLSICLSEMSAECSIDGPFGSRPDWLAGMGKEHSGVSNCCGRQFVAVTKKSKKKTPIEGAHAQEHRHMHEHTHIRICTICMCG